MRKDEYPNQGFYEKTIFIVNVVNIMSGDDIHSICKSGSRSGWQSLYFRYFANWIIIKEVIL